MITAGCNRKDNGQLALGVKELGSAIVSHFRMADLIYGISQAPHLKFFLQIRQRPQVYSEYLKALRVLP